MNMNPTKTKSLAGPLILITIGTMFLIQNLSHINVFRVFWRYWPVILIVIGISKLLEYFRAAISLPVNLRRAMPRTPALISFPPHRYSPDPRSLSKAMNRLCGDIHAASSYACRRHTPHTSGLFFFPRGSFLPRFSRASTVESLNPFDLGF
jgi:hypothetical protein